MERSDCYSERIIKERTIMGKPIIKMTAGVISYLFKYRPYITVWIVCFIGAGICESVKDHDIGGLIACTLFAFATLIIKRILLMISRIVVHNRYDEKLLGIAPKGRFMNHMYNYMAK